MDDKSEKRIPQIPLPSIDDMKALVYKESGYTMHISGEDPLLTVVYLNQAVLGATLRFAREQFAEENRAHLDRIERKYQNVLEELAKYRQQAGSGKRPPNQWHESPAQQELRTANENARRQQQIDNATLIAGKTASQLQEPNSPVMQRLAELVQWNIKADKRGAQLPDKLYLVVGAAIFASVVIGVVIGRFIR